MQQRVLHWTLEQEEDVRENWQSKDRTGSSDAFRKRINKGHPSTHMDVSYALGYVEEARSESSVHPCDILEKTSHRSADQRLLGVRGREGRATKGRQRAFWRSSAVSRVCWWLADAKSFKKSGFSYLRSKTSI